MIATLPIALSRSLASSLVALRCQFCVIEVSIVRSSATFLYSVCSLAQEVFRLLYEAECPNRAYPPSYLLPVITELFPMVGWHRNYSTHRLPNRLQGKFLPFFSL